MLSLKPGLRPYLLSYLLALPVAIAAALLQPIWNPIDEAAHFDLVDQYAHGVPAAVGTPMRPETVALMRIHGVNPGVQLEMPLQPFASPPVGTSAHAGEVWLRRHLWEYSDEALQPPLYYLAAIPFWLAGYDAGGPAGALYTLRLLNAFLFAMLAPISFALCRLLLPTSRWAPRLAAALAAVMPGTLYDGTHVTNDAAATVGSSAVLLFAAWRSARGWAWRSSLLAGALVGLALLIKPTAAGIAIATAVAMLISPSASVAARLGHLALAAGAGLAVFLPWPIANRILFGAFTQFNQPQVKLILDLVPPAPIDALQGVQQSLAGSFDFWGLGLFAVVMVALSLFALPGIVHLLLERSGGANRIVLAICLTGFAGQGAFALLLPALSGTGAPSPGRYMYPAVAAAFVIVIAGWWKYRVPGYLGVALLAITALALIVSLPGRVVTNAGRPVSRFGQPAPTASSIGLRGQGSANGLTAQVDSARYDPTTQTLWLHYIATNQSTGSVEWVPTPVLLLDGAPVPVARVTYGFTADTLRPDDVESGWVDVTVDRGRLGAARSVAVSFPDVADLGYQHLQDLELPLCSLTSTPSDTC